MTQECLIGTVIVGMTEYKFTYLIVFFCPPLLGLDETRIRYPKCEKLNWTWNYILLDRKIPDMIVEKELC